MKRPKGCPRRLWFGMSQRQRRDSRGSVWMMWQCAPTGGITFVSGAQWRAYYDSLGVGL